MSSERKPMLQERVTAIMDGKVTPLPNSPRCGPLEMQSEPPERRQPPNQRTPTNRRAGFDRRGFMRKHVIVANRRSGLERRGLIPKPHGGEDRRIGERRKPGRDEHGLYDESLSLALAAYVSSRYSAKLPTTKTASPRLSPFQQRQVFEYLHAHLGRRFSLVELAGVVHLSPRHFSRLFQNTLGTTPYQYVLNERIREAKLLLAAKRLSILEISETVGFASQSHFTDVFHKATGVSPRRYQRGY